MTTNDSWSAEVRSGQRFRFGANWQRFVAQLTDDQMERARASMRELLGLDDLTGRSFLDIGMGSGINSLAARELGASVRAFDYDPDAVDAAMRLRDLRRPGDKLWVIDEASVLDRDYLTSIGTFDVVYSWGVLHHTGAMWEAIRNVMPLVKPGGLLAIAIYNDQGKASLRARQMKRRYLSSGSIGKTVILLGYLIPKFGRRLMRFVIHREHPLGRYHNESRGMDWWHDAVDWVGGYPFEFAKPERVLEVIRPGGFELLRMVTVGDTPDNNQYVFRRLGPNSVAGADPTDR
jgi:2-polyprenyl-3-methyl-5-hydroxy-6-metoxy-1,4-benzoquinol methylase